LFVTINPPVTAILNANGGTVVMDYVVVNSTCGPPYSSLPMVYLENVQDGSISNFETSIAAENEYLPSGFVFIRSYVVLENVTLSNLRAVQPADPTLPYFDNGGAIYSESSHISIQTSKILQCIGGNGGAIYALNSIVTVENCTFSGNQAVSANASLCGEDDVCQGGAIYINSSTVPIINSFIVRNEAYSGGGVFAQGNHTNNSSSIFFNILFYVIFYFEICLVYIESCTVSGNIATVGGAITLENNSSSFINDNTVFLPSYSSHPYIFCDLLIDTTQCRKPNRRGDMHVGRIC
jgi:hypothetical protein